MIIYPALEYAYDESYIRTPAMEISNTWRAAAVFVGAVLLACRRPCASCCCR